MCFKKILEKVKNGARLRQTLEKPSTGTKSAQGQRTSTGS